MRRQGMKQHKGFPSVSKLVAAMRFKGLEQTKYCIVRFRQQFYAISFDSYSKEIFSGCQEVWCRVDGWMLQIPFADFVLPYPMSSGRVMKNITTTLAMHLINEDPEIGIFLLPRRDSLEPVAVSLRDTRYYCFLVWLGISFQTDHFCPVNRLGRLSAYFRDVDIYRSFAKNFPAVAAINPFSQKVILHNDVELRYSIDFSRGAPEFRIESERNIVPDITTLARGGDDYD